MKYTFALIILYKIISVVHIFDADLKSVIVLMKEKEKMGSLHSRCYNVLCDLVLIHMPKDLEKGNGVICKIFSFSLKVIVKISYANFSHTFWSVITRCSLLFYVFITF